MVGLKTPFFCVANCFLTRFDLCLSNFLDSERRSRKLKPFVFFFLSACRRFRKITPFRASENRFSHTGFLKAMRHLAVKTGDAECRKAWRQLRLSNFGISEFRNFLIYYAPPPPRQTSCEESKARSACAPRFLEELRDIQNCMAGKS